MSRRVALVFAVLAVSLVFPRASSAQPKEVVIGAVYPLSGNLAKVGNDIKDAIELAAELVNEDVDLPVPLGKGKGLPNLGGARVRVVFADHQSSPEKGLSEAERLISQEKVIALIGSYNSNVTATASQAQDSLPQRRLDLAAFDVARVPLVLPDHSHRRRVQRELLQVPGRDEEAREAGQERG